jgi:hypothetical protein
MVAGRRSRRPDQRGAILPSPVVMLSILAVAMAAIAFVATRGGEPEEREVTPVAQEPESTPSSSPTTEPKKKRKPEPVIRRGEIYVEVYNNSNVSGLAGRVADRATGAGWKVVGSDNWVGTIPANTVYYPKRLKEEAELLALDLGIRRTYLAVAPMKLDRLTVILTGELG